MKIKLDIKPLSINKAFQGRRFKTPEYDDYTDLVSGLLQAQKRMFNLTKRDYNIYTVSYNFYLVNHKKTDLDNMVKLITDLLVLNGFIKDDRMIYSMNLKKIPSDKDWVEIDIVGYSN